MNYFDWFEINWSFFPDQVMLKKKFYALSRLYHPDFYVQQGEVERLEAEEKLQEINKAYATLSNPIKTMAYLLKQTVGLPEEEKFTLSPDFLMEMMELNEALQDAETEEEKEKVKEKITTQQHSLYEQVEPIMANYQAGITTQEEMLQVKHYYYQQKYLQRLLEEGKSY
ncbi:MAG: Fe-S protein assembly co-chaperone HscB [Chitinophagia bacterium]|jgi:molecular chaperone HscB